MATRRADAVLGEHGEPCEECGSPLAADQRYCLNCGRRRGGPRVDYRQLHGGPAEARGSGRRAAGRPLGEPGRRGRSQQRDYAPLAAVGGIAVLGLMLLVGVLIGKGNSEHRRPPRRRSSGRSAKSPGGGEHRRRRRRRLRREPKSTEGSRGGGTAAKKAKGGLTGDGGRHRQGAVQASDGRPRRARKARAARSYDETSEKLPDKIATPGQPPPIDKSRPPGGGKAERKRSK